jgi:ribosome maturation factor RimP
LHEVRERVTGILEPLLPDYGLELVDVEYKKEGAHWYLRVFIDKPGGVGLDDCSQVSNLLNARLDTLEEHLNQHYFLEVSSPGIERPLTKPSDYQRYKGEQVAIRTLAKVDGAKHFQGKLVDLDGDQVILETEQGRVTIPLELISRARLKVF